ncbi:MAG: hypothetical protein R3E48_23305 [Burkholderiaceae bacterium]
MIERRIEEVNAALATGYAGGRPQIHRFRSSKETDADDGELTRTQKVRRPFIARALRPAHQGAVRRLQGSPHPVARGDLREDGRKGIIEGNVRIVDTKVFLGTAALKEAAE